MSVLVTTEVIITSFDGKDVEEPVKVFVGETYLRVVKTKIVLGITLDNKLSFKEHIQRKTKEGFGALKSLDTFAQGHRSCSQSVHMKLSYHLVFLW